ncbi:response regulator [Bacillus alkalicellulosilyticus]|uniref:response regulator n=1 Tax=Alkalihalobacterium alkalicellulosilyticum TaxID=1912214 RepID=UPI00099651BE|nr:response regulator [Bacillus alkalicellulosilyticus]
MKKIFVVDDEIVVREGIRNCIDWVKEGFIYCGDAPDGEIALPLIEKHQPDIVITDIKMPFMDGLEISRILRKKMPQTKIIILSGHDEFEYAQEAIRIDINDYCLKPLSASELLDILNRVSLQIDHEEMERKRVLELQSQANQSVTMSRDKFLMELCEGSYSTSSAIEKASKLGINLIANHYFVLILEDEQNHMDSIRSIITADFISFKRKTNEHVFIIRGVTKSQLEETIINIKQSITPSRSQAIGIGSIKDRIQEISQSFTEAYDQKYQHVKYTSFQFKDAIPELPLQMNKKELQHFLKFGNTVEIQTFCEEYIATHTRMVKETPFWSYYVLIEFTNTTIEFVKEINPQNTAILTQFKSIEWKSGNNKGQIIDYMVELLEIVIKHRDLSQSKNYPLIEKAKDYIKNNYHNPELSLQMVANVVNISPSYFSHLFSQETGQTLKEYLTTVRIEKAKELLLTTSEKTYEIALKVGYNDSHYFCNMFKKLTGFTTKKFKNQGKITMY